MYSPVLSHRGSYNPVSYTHLDVYKRQAQERLKGVGVLSREDAISFGATGGTGRASGDVYKRQALSLTLFELKICDMFQIGH